MLLCNDADIYIKNIFGENAYDKAKQLNNKQINKLLQLDRQIDSKDTIKFKYEVLDWERILKMKYLNGVLIEKGILINGIKEGEWKYYHPNGSLMEINYYSLGKLNGPSKGWFNNGQPSFIGEYVNDSLNGEVKVYNRKGILYNVTNYENGLAEGECKFYNSDGSLDFILYYEKDSLVKSSTD